MRDASVPEVVLRAPRLIDGVSAAPLDDGGVLIRAGRIAAACRFAGLPDISGIPVIDLPDHTLAPGLIDAHSHATIDTAGGNEHAQIERPAEEVALRAAHHLRRDLCSGVTTIRTLGDRNLVDVLLRRMQAEGTVTAPRMQVAGHLIQSSRSTCRCQAQRPTTSGRCAASCAKRCAPVRIG